MHGRRCYCSMAGNPWAPASGLTPARAWHHDRWHLTSVHLHIPGAAELLEAQARAGQDYRQTCPSRWQQVPVSWQGRGSRRGGPQCPGGTCIHAGPRVPSQLMALEIGASAALEQPEKPRQARGPGSVTRTLRLVPTLRATPGRTEPATGLECSVHAGGTNPFINIQSLAVP